jgi:hypothetical protein
MSKQRKTVPKDNAFENTPLREELLDWSDSPEAEQIIWDLMEDVQLDAKHRKFIWPDAERLDLEQSVQRIRKQYQDIPADQIEELLIDWIDMGYAPENYSQAQLDEFDKLTERWISDHMRRHEISKEGKKTRHS